ncbi:MAG: hypothetical protein QF712_05685 [Candidatus Marinimicrobia bacterium]|jgi:excinuclease UvrABC nuclease subunit|nr:hypothetical protein [Candidatus Neomarinimicrobiota bacterium]MDP7526763.1 hypothetical protein [Candidatus Neomarinimicrobiota bacterium]|tara:strand:+ start:2471 stop:2881 length:411 start_codon:yes stop_codon:yes gene_type:complete
MDYKKIITKEGLLPIENWNTFEFLHVNPNSSTDKMKNKNELKEKVSDSGGLYIYKQGRDILYIGKAKSLLDRLFSHYRESFEAVSGDTKTNKWHRFFSKYNGKVKIFWYKVEKEPDRKIFEIMLQEIYRTKFDDFR